LGNGINGSTFQRYVFKEYDSYKIINRMGTIKMKKKFYERMRRLITLSICSLVIALVFSGAIAQSGTISGNEQTKNNTSIPSKTPLPYFLNFFIRDWNWWDKKPDMFCIPDGNIGIGTMNPLAKLDVFGNIAINGEEIINESGVWVGDPTGLQGPQGPPGDSRWGLNGDNIYYNNGSVGIGTASPLSKFQITDGSVLFDGETGGTPVSGGGTRLMWIPSKSAFRVGSTFGNLWDDVNIGSHSIAMGFATKANQYGSTAMGAYTTASSVLATAMGEYTTATGYGSTTMGVESVAHGFASIAMGFNTVASGWASTAMGQWTNANGDSSTALGTDTVANGACSTAIGSSIIVNGNYSVGIGLNNQWPFYQVDQSNILSILGGNVGIGTIHPDATLEVSGTMKVFGEWQDDLTYDTVYQAETDGFVSALLYGQMSGAIGQIIGFTDSSASPTTIRGYASMDYGTNTSMEPYNSFLMPVKKDEYWKIYFQENMANYCGVTISWIPLGTEI